MKSFEEIYKEIIENDAKKFINRRKIINIIIIIAYIILFIVLIKLGRDGNINYDFILKGIIAFLVLVLTTSLLSSKYTKDYKKIIISKFLKQINESFDIYPDKGIDEADYQKSGFKEGNKIESKDMIIGKLENELLIQMTDIKIKNQEECEDKIETETLFEGLFVRVDFKKSIKKPIMLLANQKKFRNLSAKIDNPEFEKYYDIVTENNLQAYQLYTADIIEKILEFIEKTKLYPEIIIKERYLYIRIASQNLFEPTSFNFGFDKRKFEIWYEIIKLVNDMSNHLLNTIMNEIL